MGRRQFRLRTLAVVVVGFALLFAFVRWVGTYPYVLIVISRSVVWWGICFGIATFGGLKSGGIVRGRLTRVAAWCLLAVVASLSIYLAWAHYRTVYLSFWGLDRNFPYPDPAIKGLERWFDARHPVSPGTLKLHGEIPRVAYVLGLLTLGFLSLTGVLWGILLKRSSGPGSAP